MQRDISAILPFALRRPRSPYPVLWELTGNAHKYASAGLIDQGGGWTGTEEVLIGVADHGPGMPAEEALRRLPAASIAWTESIELLCRAWQFGAWLSAGA